MGILDDAIRQHLDLKRKHGARDAELREIEDEAFGASDQSDPFVAGGELFAEGTAAGTAEASPGGAPSAGAVETPPPDLGNEEPTRLVEPEALPREPEPLEPDLVPYEEEPDAPESLEPLPGQTELPGQDEIPGQERLDEPAESYQPSEPEPAPEPVPEPAAEPAPEPPAPSESLEELIAEEEPFPEDSTAPPPEAHVEPIPSADRGGALEATELEPEDEPEEPVEPSEPESSVPEPPPPPPATGPEPPGRARGRIDVPTQEHPPPGETGGVPAVPPPEPDTGPELDPGPEPDVGPGLEAEPEPDSSDAGGPALYDFETDDEPLGGAPPAEPADEFEVLGPADEETPYLDEEEPYAEDPASGTELPVEEPATEDRPAVEEPGTEVRPALDDEDAFEGTSFDLEEPREEGDTDDDLWFEKGPPKDFDFD